MIHTDLSITQLSKELKIYDTIAFRFQTMNEENYTTAAERERKINHIFINLQFCKMRVVLQRERKQERYHEYKITSRHTGSKG